MAILHSISKALTCPRKRNANNHFMKLASQRAVSVSDVCNILASDFNTSSRPGDPACAAVSAERPSSFERRRTAEPVPVPPPPIHDSEGNDAHGSSHAARSARGLAHFRVNECLSIDFLVFRLFLHVPSSWHVAHCPCFCMCGIVTASGGV